MGEETAEFIMACKDNDKDEIANEASDIIYHLQVALLYKGVQWRDVLTILESRRKKIIKYIYLQTINLIKSINNNY